MSFGIGLHPEEWEKYFEEHKFDSYRVEVFKELVKQESKCLHESCPMCHGTGVKSDGSPCFHMISCPCPKCTPR